MAQRICSVDDCDHAHSARGLCAMHWKRQYGKRYDLLYRTCVVCDVRWATTRADAKYCSELCYHFDKWGARTSAWPRRVPRAAKPKPPPFREQRECAWCGDMFTATKRAMINCSHTCKVKAIKNRRRGRQHGSTSHFTWAEFMRLFIRFDRCCAYCEQVIEGQPEPDHVVPLSRGGSNSITNILPCCSLCNADKRDLLLHEWEADRARRDKPRRTTSWATDDRRFTHLTDAALISPAA